MNADAFRQVYTYHFAENRKIWDRYITALSPEQFTQDMDYSYGSVRDQVVHLMSSDDYWFSGLRGLEMPESLNPADFDDQESVRAYWDGVEQTMRNYLAGLWDEMLFDHPLGGEDKELILWQVLLHVTYHGMDHRAQILRLLHDLGFETGSQDYIFYLFENM